MSTPIVEQLKYIFNPRSVAVIGASDTFGTWGYGVMNAVLAPAVRQIYPVNRKTSEVFGLKAYQSILEIPEAVDFAAIVLPASEIPRVMEECVGKGVKAALIIAGGLAEVSKEGAKNQAEITRIARCGGIRFIGPNSMGHLDTSSQFCTIAIGWMADTMKGPVGFISQSGTYGQRLLRTGLEAGVGFSKFVSSGNEADLHLEDYLEYLAADEETKLIAIYMEGLREGKRFFQLARQITPRKPIVVMKAAGTPVSAKAATSHTSAIAGADMAYTAMFRQSGIIRVSDDDELFDIIIALLYLPLPQGRRVGILTEGGGAGVVAAEACEREGLEIPHLSPATLEKLSALLPPRWSHGNPADMTDAVAAGRGKLATFPCLWAIMEDENIDAAMLNGGIGAVDYYFPLDKVPSFLSRESVNFLVETLENEEHTNLNIINRKVKEYQKPLVFCRVMPKGNLPDPKPLIMLHEKGIPVYPHPHRAARVLHHLVYYREYLNANQGAEA